MYRYKYVVLIIYAIQVTVYFGPDTATTIVGRTYEAYTAGVCVCVFNDTVGEYTAKRLVTMNNELETEWVTGMSHRWPENLTSYSDVIWLSRARAFELVSIKQNN